MPATTIKTKNTNSETIVMFITDPTENPNEFYLKIYVCDDKHLPNTLLTNPKLVRDSTEEEYHTNLRKDAFERESLLIESCTNPEWFIDENK